jgi:hypothetical protein
METMVAALTIMAHVASIATDVVQPDLFALLIAISALVRQNPA